MIIKGQARGRSRQLAAHLMRADENERIRLYECRGTVARDVAGALLELELRAAAVQSARPLYHASISPEAHVPMTDDQVRIAVDTLEAKLGFAAQPRVVVLHRKAGREHVHVVWSRIDLAKGRAISDAWNYRHHEEAARELEQRFSHRRVDGVHVPQIAHRPRRRAARDYEYRQAERSGQAHHLVTDEITALWKVTGGGEAFRQRLEAAGYTLARGDRRVFVVLDRAGTVHSLARRIDGIETRQLREKMQGVGLQSLPSVGEAREGVRQSVSRERLRKTFRAAATEATARERRATVETVEMQQAWHRVRFAAQAFASATHPVLKEGRMSPPMRLLSRGTYGFAAAAFRAKRAAIIAHYAARLADARAHASPDQHDALIDALSSERQAALDAFALSTDNKKSALVLRRRRRASARGVLARQKRRLRFRRRAGAFQG